MKTHLLRSRATNAFLLFAVWLPACGSSTGLATFEAEIAHQETASAPESTATVAESAAVVVSDQTSAELSVSSLPPIVLGSSEFHASDPESVQLSSGKVQLVEFFAYWCAVCKAMAPSIHGLENLYSDSANFIYLDREDPETFSLQAQLGYIYQPHFFLLDEQGIVLAQWRGYVDTLLLQQALVDALSH